MFEDGFYHKLGKILRFYREKNNLTQEQIAYLTQVDRTYIARIETGRANPTITILYKLAKGLNISLSDFLKELS